MKSVLAIWKQQQANIACFLGLCLIAGFLWSRALLSVSIIMLTVNALHPQGLSSSLRLWLSDGFAGVCLFFFISALLSGLWSEDTFSWCASLKNKIPFLVLPFAFMAVPPGRDQNRKWLLSGLVLMHMLIVLYSLIYLLIHWESSVQGYGFSKVLPTNRYDDHIRFSLSLAFCVLILLYLIRNARSWFRKGERRFLRILIVLFIVYLHLLASKTGLIALYIILTGYVLHLFHRHRVLATFVSILTLSVLSLSAYHFLPTFKNRIDYVFWEIKEYRAQGRLDYNYSDAGRLISYELSLKLIGNAPGLGVGLGDVQQEMMRQYEKHYREVPSRNQLVPHNQFLFSMTAVGIPMGISSFLLLFFLFQRNRKKVLFAGITVAVFLLAFMTEAMLEVQFGVFVFLFYTLLWRCWLQKEIVHQDKQDS